MPFANVHVGLPLEGPFTYSFNPEINLKPGMRVKVPFGKRKLMGFVVEVVDKIEKTNFEIKEILEVVDDQIIYDKKLIDLAKYTSFNYLCSPGEVFSMALPSSGKESNRYKNPFGEYKPYNFNLSAAQKKVYDDIVSGEKEGKKAHLIYGITGSGKTEIYISLAKKAIDEGKSVIYLVPEINLSSQIFKRLYNVFKDLLVPYHSRLTPNQRLDNWKKFYSGEARIAVGTRSAIFLQSEKTGLIIVDEEHDGSYKENSTPRYNARRLAMFRSSYENAMVIFGSATPSMESLYGAEKGVFQLHRLTERFGDAKLPEIRVTDIDPKRPDEILSTQLRALSQQAVRDGFQAIYLLNRRGFAPIIMCSKCKTKVECPDCNVTMNYHKNGALLCHYCGYESSIPDNCEKCNNDELIKLGAGTQRIEEILEDLFKNYRVGRLDQDTSRKKDAVNELVKKMESGDLDILVGTQMVSKGFDFSKVTVVGVLMADIGINLPDFRATERVYSMLTQIAGRSGRGDHPGVVLIQTLNSENEIFTYLKNHDYDGFYKRELEIRKMLDYPPFSRIIRLLVRGENETKVEKSINEIYDRLAPLAGNDILILGPAPAPLQKMGGNYRHHIILKSKDMKRLKEITTTMIRDYRSKDSYLEVDVDPYDML